MSSDVAARHAPALADQWSAIDRPTLVIDRERVRRNLQRMRDKAEASGVRFRPHVKSHNSPVVAGLYRDVGVSAITVSSIEMARRFADAGWSDITIAFPMNLRALPELTRLAGAIRLGVLIDSSAAATALGQVAAPVDVWIDIDAGYLRTGVPWDDRAALARLFDRVQASGRHRVRGVLTHSGQAYRVPEPAARVELWEEVAGRMQAARGALSAGGGGPDLEISVGDTPSCSVVPRFDGVDEVRPGNFLFFDLQQHALGSCRSTDLALVVACPVVGVYPERGEVVVQGGAIHLSRDVAPGPSGTTSHGQLAVMGPEGWDLLPSSDAYVRGLSQEHGMIRCAPAVLEAIRVGDLVFVVPAHACLAANLVGRFVFLDEPGIIRGP